jgi:beta-lactam-binding protein with PASTA domain
MAEKSSGPSTATIALIVALATPVVLFLLFWLVGSGSGTATAKLPNVQGKGLQWAQTQSKDAGFDTVKTHDALGRDRHWSDDKEWMVCFQDPQAGVRPKKTIVKLGVVKTDETCPSGDQGRYVPAGAKMPDLVNRTAFMARKILGSDASLRFLDRSNGDTVTRDLGDWKVCEQAPAPGERFDGVPVTTLVVHFEDHC